MGATAGQIGTVLRETEGIEFTIGSSDDSGDGELEPDTREAYTSVKKVEIETAGVVVEVLESEDEKIYVETEDMDTRLNYSCTQEGSTLKIESTKKLKILNGIGGVDAVIRIYLPETQLEELEIENGAGEVYVKTVNARKFSLDVGAGEGTVDHFVAQKVEMSCGAGELTAAGTILSEAEIDCGVGEVELTVQGEESDYSYEVDCGVGEVVFGDQSFSGLGVKRSASLKSSDQKEKKITIDCGVGNVTVSFTE
jgi:hypothetical protein